MIAWYVHHHGRGHLNRALCITGHLAEPVVGLSSLPRPQGWRGGWEQLPPDDTPGARPGDPTAGGTLHWAPPEHDGLRGRMARIGAVLARPEVHLLVVDVSVEVTALGALFGTRRVVVAQPGDRTDRPHRMAYDMADAILAPFPPAVVAAAPTPWDPGWVAKAHHVGGVSRFDGRGPGPVPGTRTVFGMWGAGGTDVGPARLAAAAAATPGWRWRVAGPHPPGGDGPPNLEWIGWTDDVWEHLRAADVVVTHAGLNAVAEVAAARRPAVVVAQARPHAEQSTTVRALTDLGVATALPGWPEPSAWAGHLTSAHAAGGSALAGWSSGCGAAAAARVLERFDRSGREVAV